MPAYYSPSGSSCTADEAMIDGRLRPGYREAVADGEYIHFGSTLMRDGAPSRNAVFLTDTPPSSYTMDQRRALAAARYSCDAEAAYRETLDARKEEVRNAWRDTGPSAEPTVRDRQLSDALQRAHDRRDPAQTLDAEAQYMRDQERRRDEVRNAWKNRYAMGGE